MRFLRWGKRKDKAPTPSPAAQVVDRKNSATGPPPPKKGGPPPKAEPWDSRTILEHLRSLSPTEFEHTVTRLLAAMGYTSVKRIGGAGDLGVDILCHDAHGGLVAVQCKRYAPSKKVTSPDIATFFGMMVHRAARQGIYVTTSGFTKAALSLAAERDIGTIDGAGAAALFARHPAALGLGQLWEPPRGRTSFERECRYCRQMIQLREVADGRWMPFDVSGTRHDCRARRL